MKSTPHMSVCSSFRWTTRWRWGQEDLRHGGRTQEWNCISQGREGLPVEKLWLLSQTRSYLVPPSFIRMLFWQTTISLLRFHVCLYKGYHRLLCVRTKPLHKGVSLVHVGIWSWTFCQLRLCLGYEICRSCREMIIRAGFAHQLQVHTS